MGLGTQVVDAEQLIVKHLDVWTSAQTAKSTAGRGSNNKIELTGIKKLRELILELAVRGKLVAQDPNDEPASELIKKIAKEKDTLAKAGKISKPKSVKAVTEIEMPFDLPKGWAWARLPDTYYSISPSGKTLKTSEILQSGEYPVVDQGQKYISGYSNDASLCLRLVSPVIVFGDHTKNIKHVDFDFVAGADGTKILCPILISSRYFYYGLLQFDLDDRGYGRHFKILNDKLFAIPPLNEQLRIVAALEALMALCDQLEQQSYQSIDAHNQLVDTLLQTLVDSANADELASNWQRLSEHFDTLFTTEYSIDALKQTILQLAVMGKLVKQDPTDEPASELLKRIAKEKEALIKAKVYQKTGSLSLKKPMLLPPGWGCVQMGDICPSIVPSRDKPTSFNGSIPWVTLPDFPKNGLHLDHSRVQHKMNIEEISASGARIIPPGSILMSCVGRFGLTAINDVEVTCNQQVHAYVVLDGLNPEFLSLVIKSAIRDIEKRSSKTTVAYLNKSKCESIQLGLPPINEQNNIVSKVSDLFSLCDDFLDALSSSHKTKNLLAENLVEKVVA